MTFLRSKELLDEFIRSYVGFSQICKMFNGHSVILTLSVSRYMHQKRFDSCTLYGFQLVLAIIQVDYIWLKNYVMKYTHNKLLEYCKEVCVLCSLFIRKSCCWSDVIIIQFGHDWVLEVNTYAKGIKTIHKKVEMACKQLYALHTFNHNMWIVCTYCF